MKTLYTLSAMMPNEGATERTFAFTTEVERDKFSEVVRGNELWSRRSVGSIVLVTAEEADGVLKGVDKQRQDTIDEIARIDAEIAAQRARELEESNRDEDHGMASGKKP